MWRIPIDGEGSVDDATKPVCPGRITAYHSRQPAGEGMWDRGNKGKSSCCGHAMRLSESLQGLGHRPGWDTGSHFHVYKVGFLKAGWGGGNRVQCSSSGQAWP